MDYKKKDKSYPSILPHYHLFFLPIKKYEGGKKTLTIKVVIHTDI